MAKGKGTKSTGVRAYKKKPAKKKEAPKKKPAKKNEVSLLEIARDAYRDLSRTASAINRQLAFAGIAVVWIFKVNTGTKQMLPGELALPMVFLIASLIFDWLQYVIAVAIWGLYGRILEVRQENNMTIPRLAPRWFNWPADAFFWLKLIALAAAYTLIGVYFKQFF